MSGRKARAARQDAARAERARVEAEYADLESGVLDAVLVACDGCGLVQVAPSRTPCVLCAGVVGTFVEWLETHHLYPNGG